MAIRILHVAQAAGGVDRYIRMLLKYLDKDKFENILVCSQDFKKEDYEGLVDAFEQIEMNRAIGVKDLKLIWKVRKLIKKYNPDKYYVIIVTWLILVVQGIIESNFMNYYLEIVCVAVIIIINKNSVWQVLNLVKNICKNIKRKRKNDENSSFNSN